MMTWMLQTNSTNTFVKIYKLLLYVSTRAREVSIRHVHISTCTNSNIHIVSYMQQRDHMKPENLGAWAVPLKLFKDL